MDNPDKILDMAKASEDEPEISAIKEPLVLIIDDDKWIDRIISKYVGAWGFKTISAQDPVLGIGQAVNQNPDVIFLDIYLPEINGYTILKILKEINVTTNIPVIIISANLNKEILTASFKNGASGFISKPIVQNVLLEKLQECLNDEMIKKLNIPAKKSES